MQLELGVVHVVSLGPEEEESEKDGRDNQQPAASPGRQVDPQVITIMAGNNHQWYFYGIGHMIPKFTHLLALHSLEVNWMPFDTFVATHVGRVENMVVESQKYSTPCSGKSWSFQPSLSVPYNRIKSSMLLVQGLAKLSQAAPVSRRALWHPNDDGNRFWL